DLYPATLRLRSGFGNGNLRWLSAVEAKTHRSAKAAFIKSSFLRHKTRLKKEPNLLFPFPKLTL
ncbi:MAG: hypothetical protein WA949_07495, partial [Phormidesmis sp.]